MFNLSKGQGGAREAKRVIINLINTNLEMGADIDGLCCELSRSRKGNKGIWVIVDWLTKRAHFILVTSNRAAATLAKLYVREVVRLHGVSTSIVSDRNPLFTSEF